MNRSSHMFQLRLQCSWLAGPDGNQPLDPKLFPLLAAIRSTGSLSRAAAEVGFSYRHVWNMVGRWETLMGHPLVLLEQGRGARLTALGEKLLWAEKRVQGRLAPQLESLAAQLQREFTGVLVAEGPALVIHASHDIALSGLRELMAARGGLQLDLQFHGSVDSLASLARGRCDLAGFHVSEQTRRGSMANLALRQWLRPRSHRLVHFVTRRQGLIVATGNPMKITSLADLTRPGARFVNRQRGSGTRLAFDQLLLDADIDTGAIQGYQSEEFTHLAVAATVGGGQADAGFGIKAAAVQYGLDFVPLLDEHYFLACRSETLTRRDFIDFLAVLRSAEFRALVGSLSGYEAAQAGQVMAVREALPWYDHPRAAKIAAPRVAAS